MLDVSAHESSVSVNVDASSTPGHVTPPPTLDLHLDDEQTLNVEKISATRRQAHLCSDRSKTPHRMMGISINIEFCLSLHGFFAKRV